MGHRFFKSFLLGALLVLPAFPAAGASFWLPDDAKIEVRPFAFPPGSSTGESSAFVERNVSGTFQEQIAYALRRAGFTVVAEAAEEVSRDSAAKTPADQNAGARPQADENEKQPLISHPITEADDAPNPDESAEDYDVSGLSDSAESEEDSPNADAAEADETRAEAPSLWGKVYILKGQVTFLRENIGAPVRIGGGVRIRTEASMHCSYTLEDAATGKALVADAASGSAARVISQTRDIDAVLSVLTGRVLNAAATVIVERLSGADAPEARAIADDRAEYQDSPGKRLKPKTQ